MNQQTQQKTAGGAPAASQKPEALPPIARGRISPAQVVRMQWRLVAPSAAHFEALLKSNIEVWQHVGSVQSGDTVEIVDDNSTAFALVYVRLAIGSGAGGLQHIEVVELFKTKLGEAAEAPPATGVWSVMFRGPHAKWCLINPNGLIVREGMHTREEAQVALSQQSVGRVKQQAVTW